MISANGRIIAAARVFGIMASQVVVSEDAAKYPVFVSSSQPTGNVFLQEVAAGGRCEEMTLDQAIHRKVMEVLALQNTDFEER